MPKTEVIDSFRSAPQYVLPVGRATPEGLRLLGACFLVGERRLVTSKHVTGGDETGLVVVLPRTTTTLEYIDTSDKRVDYVGAQISVIDPFRDLCILEIGESPTPPYALGSVDDVAPGERVVTFGFPHSDTGRLVLTEQHAEVGARILLGASGLKSKHIVLNVQARPGQSGGPVFAGDGRSIVAVIVGSYVPTSAIGAISLGGIDPHSLHQTTHAISAEYVAAMLQ